MNEASVIQGRNSRLRAQTAILPDRRASAIERKSKAHKDLGATKIFFQNDDLNEIVTTVLRAQENCALPSQRARIGSLEVSLINQRQLL